MDFQSKIRNFLNQHNKGVQKAVAQAPIFGQNLINQFQANLSAPKTNIGTNVRTQPIVPQKFTQPVRNYFNPTMAGQRTTGNFVPNFWDTKAAQGLGQVQQNIQQGLPRVNLQQYTNRIQAPVPRTVAQFGAAMGEDVLSTPQRLLEGGYRLGTEIRTGGIRDPRRALGAYAAVAEPLFDVATLGTGTPFKQVVKQGAKQIATQGLKKTLTKGALKGAGYGAVFGGLRGLSEGEEADFTKGLTNALMGAGGGAVLGGGLAGGGALFGKVVNAVKKTSPGISDKEAQKKAAIYLRDTAGRFTGLKNNQEFQTVRGTSKPGNIKINDWQDNVNRELGVDPNYRIPAGLQIDDVSKRYRQDAKNAYKVVSGQKQSSLISPKDSEFKVPFSKEVFDQLKRKHPDKTTLTFNEALGFVKTLHFPNQINKLPQAKRNLYFRSLAGELSNKINQVVVKPMAKDEKSYLNSSYVLGGKRRINKALLEGSADPSSPIGGRTENISTLKSTNTIIPQNVKGGANPQKVGDIMGEGFKPGKTLTRSRGVGSYTNVPEIDNRLFKGSTPPPKSGSVLKDIKGGFDRGRKIREQTQNATKGSLNQRARTEFIDRLSPVYDFVKDGKKIGAENNPYKKMRLLAGISGKVEAYADKNVRPILTKEKNRTDDLSALWALERERELVGTKGLTRKRTAEEIEQGVNELRAKYGEEGFKTLQESSQQLRKVGDDLLIKLKDAGIISEESFKAIKAKNQFYAPMEAVERMADNLEKGRGTGSFNVASQDVIKGIKSYTGDVGDPIEALVRRIPKVIALAEKNKAIKSFTDLRNTNKELYGDLIKPIKGDPPEGMGVINVFENGENVRYAVPEVIESAIKNLDAQSAGILVKLSKGQASLLRAGATGLNIGFIPVNIVRDVQDALTTELTENGAKAMFKFLASYPHAILSAAGKGKLYKEWAEAGGLQSTMLEQILKSTPKTVAELSGKRNLFKTVISSPKSAVEFLNRVGEQSTRLARYKSGVARGEDVTEAAFKSRDISLDFAKAGNSIKVLNQVIPFLNAGIQGSEKLVRLYKTNPVAATASTSIMFGLPTIALYQHNSQFKDYSDVPDSEKQNNWLIIARDRTPEEIAANEKVIGVKIPKGFLGRIVSNTIESSMSFATNRDPQTFANFALDTTEGLSPVGLPVDKERTGRSLSRILPPAVKAVAEGVSNTNFYFGSPIVSQGLQNLPPSEQYREKTPEIYKKAGQLTGASPLILENTVNSMTGGLGRQFAQFFSGDVEGSTTGQITRRFSGIQGGVNADKAWEQVDKEKQYTALRNKQLKEAFNAGNMKEFERLSEGMTSQQIKSLITNEVKKQSLPDMSSEQKAYESLTKEEKRRVLQDRPDLQSKIEFIPGADATEDTPFSTGLKIDPKEIQVETRVGLTGKPEVYNNKYYYINENGNQATIDMDFEVKVPELTGQTILDKKIKSGFQGDITTKQNNVVKLYELGKLTSDQAQKELQKLEDTRSSIKGGGGGSGSKKGVKIDFKQFIRKAKPLKLKAPRLTKAPFIKLKNPKISELKLKELKYKDKPLKLKKS